MYDIKATDVQILGEVNLQNTEIIDYGVKMIGAPLEWDSLEKVTGKGVKVLVLDTGLPQHNDLVIKDSKNFTTDKEVLDQNFHSTHVCGLLGARRNNIGVVGVAPECDIYVGKVLSDEGNGKWEWLVDGIQWGIDIGVDIISMSLGGLQPFKPLEDVINHAYNKGIILVAAAGNTGSEVEYYPASYKNVISVGAVDLNKDKAYFSTMNKNVEIVTAGVAVISTYSDNTYRKLSGTSMACPIYSGGVALLIQKSLIRHGRKPKPDEIRFLSSIMSEDKGAVGRDNKFGFGCFSFGRIIKEELPLIEVEMTIGSNKYLINGVEKEMDTAPILDQNYRTLTPVRFVGEALGVEVIWTPDKPDKVKLIRK